MNINLDQETTHQLLEMRGWSIAPCARGGYRYDKPHAVNKPKNEKRFGEDFLWHADEALQACLEAEAATGEHSVGLQGRTATVKVESRRGSNEFEPILTVTPGDTTRLEGEMPGEYYLLDTTLEQAGR